MTRGRGASKPEPVVFRGPPDRLASLLPPAEVGAAPEAVEGPEARLEGAEIRRLTVRSTAREGPEVRKATLRLPRSTPPGRYEGSARIGGQELPIVAEVEPRPRLQAHPPRLSVEAGPGEEVTVDATLRNTGNVPCDVSGKSTLCLFDGRGIDHAFWVALTSEPPEGKQRIDLLLDDLATSHGGLVEVRVAEGGGRIASGESREVRLTLRFSDRISAGHAYAGAWEVEGLRLPVRVTVPERKRKRPAKVAT